jgi:hypothetical protein
LILEASLAKDESTTNGTKQPTQPGMGQNSEVKKEGHPSSRPLDQNESEPHKEHRKGDEGIGLKTKQKEKRKKKKKK